MPSMKTSVNVYGHETISILKLNDTSLIPPKAPCSPLAVSQDIRHRPLGTTGQLPVTITSPFLEYHINGPILNVDFCDWLLSLGMVLLRLNLCC